jgi:hypothetical protein
MDIPYGRSNFEEIRQRGYFYVDKTPFIPLLESARVGYPLFLRPRRFGKSTLLSMLEHYYDLARKDQFDDLFKGLWIHEHPTAERSSYLVLTLDFSGVAAGGDHESLRRSFHDTVKESVHDWVFAYREHAPELGWLTDRIDGYESPEALLGGVLNAVRRTGRRLYLLVDEYDHFANRLLSGGADGLYEESVVKRTGFIRTFYAKLKTGTRTGTVARMFITGVTPLLLDDLSSGFNIISHVSQHRDLNTLVGFTRADVERAVDELLTAHPEIAKSPGLSDRPALLDVLERNYDGYRFSEDATERVFNSDMVLYFLGELAGRRRYPDHMLDLNVRTDYSHLQRIGTLSGMAAVERRRLLESILLEGHIRSDLVRQFGVKSLSSHEPFISLLYYLGMLTLRDSPRDAIGYDLEIPNRVIRELQWEHLALMLKEQTEIAIQVDDLKAALGAMAVDGDIAPFLDVFHAQVIKAFGVKDTRRLDEKTIKLLFMMYASLGRAFHPLSEKEFAQGYCDLFLGASRDVANARYSWLLEFKYLQANAKPAQIEAAFAEAEGQVARYASDRELLPLLLDRRELKAGMIVFLGTKKVLFRPWPPDPRAKPPRAKAKAAKRKPRPARPRTRG